MVHLRLWFACCALVGVLNISGCAALRGLLVRQSDLDAWKGQPVEALDQQAFFMTLPMVRTKTAKGVEVRNYINGRNVSSCMASGQRAGSYYNTSNWRSFSTCISRQIACNNIFYIKRGVVLEYRPTGSCRTGAIVLPPSEVY
jgi:hypothetical protein